MGAKGKKNTVPNEVKVDVKFSNAQLQELEKKAKEQKNNYVYAHKG